jgi:hypothetical protein
MLIGVLPFWISIALLSIAQGALVAVPRAVAVPKLAGLRGRSWAAILPISVIAFVLVVRAAERASAQGLTYLALCAVPALAAVALGWPLFGRPDGRGRPRSAAWALLVLPLFALAWIDHGGLAGEGAALVLSALSCVTLAVLLAAITPPLWLAGGILAMAIADTTLVVSDLLQRPNNTLNAAHPAAGLPKLQSAVFGSAVMGYGDLFVAAALGALLAATAGRSLQLRAARLTAVMALGFDLLFFFVDELPATVPVALTLVLLLAQESSTARLLRARHRDQGDRPRRHPLATPSLPPTRAVRARAEGARVRAHETRARAEP